ncbi:hypothetical protein RJT34_24864 [Clitoria ternatea]|uniref:Transmembrane protein n=1 Tax=Clitoria ternatea TaxID=43366 RepID=A0AAN9ILB8_CLITE
MTEKGKSISIRTYEPKGNFNFFVFYFKNFHPFFSFPFLFVFPKTFHTANPKFQTLEPPPLGSHPFSFVSLSLSVSLCLSLSLFFFFCAKLFQPSHSRSIFDPLNLTLSLIHCNVNASGMRLR